MKKYILSTLIFFFTLNIHAQHRAVLSLDQPSLEKNANFQTEWLEVPIKAEPFLALSFSWKAEPGTQLYFIFKEEATNIPIIADSHLWNENGRQVSQLHFINPEWKHLKIKWNQAPTELEIHFFSPGKDEFTKADFIQPASSRACPCPQPQYLDRDGWCPNGDCPEISDPTFTDVTHLIVHHAASTNASSNWAGVVRSIWDQHVNENGWQDIGYNWLIDPNGVVYQGRGDNIQGAHFCGDNGGTVGICLLGNFENITPTTSAVEKLQELLSWKACDMDLDPEGTGFHASSGLTLHHISGHRDGCSTQCPGNMFYPMLPTVRSAVSEYTENECAFLMAPSGLTASVNSETEVQVSWQDNSGNEDGFSLERSKNSNDDFVEIASLSANTSTYTDTTLDPYTAYFYRVRATLGDDFSDYSNEYGVATVLTSTSELQLGNNVLTLFPNPVKENLQIQLTGKYSGKVNFKIYDTNLQLQQVLPVFEKKHSTQKFNLPLTDLAGGLYFLRVRMGSEEGLLKLIKIP